MPDQWTQRPQPADPRRNDDPAGTQPTDPLPALPRSPESLALPAPHADELALPPGPAPVTLQLPPPAAPGTLALPARQPQPAARSTAPDQPHPSAPPHMPRQRWTHLLAAISLLLLVVCALPSWTFALWSWWTNHRHQPPPVLATLAASGLAGETLQWSPDGRYLAEQMLLPGLTPTAPAGKAIILWDVSARRELRRFTNADGALAFAWSPNGRYFATTDGSHILIWPAQQINASTTPIARLNAHDKHQPITSLAWASDGQTLAAADEGGLDLFQAPTGSTGWQRKHYVKDSPCATSACNRLLSWSPDGRWLLAAPWHARDATSGVGIWDTQTWQQASLLDASAPLAWSPDGTLVLVRASDETTLQALHAGSWSVAWTINLTNDLGQSYSVYPQAASWSPDGAWLVSSADGWVDLRPADTHQSFWVWQEQRRDQGIYTATSLAWSPDAHTLAVTTDGTASVTLYNLRDPAPPSLF